MVFVSMNIVDALVALITEYVLNYFKYIMGVHKLIICNTVS